MEGAEATVMEPVLEASILAEPAPQPSAPHPTPHPMHEAATSIHLLPRVGTMVYAIPRGTGAKPRPSAPPGAWERLLRRLGWRGR